MKHTISKTKQHEAYARTNGLCVICGKPVGSNESEWSVEHFVPRAVSKWTKDYGAKKSIESDDNIFIVHPGCNYSKDSALPTKQLIKSMHADRKTKDEMRSMYKKVEGSVEEYRSIKLQVISRQNGKCAACGKPITLENSTLRRKDNMNGRSQANAMCLCATCNRKATSPEAKKKMISGGTKRKSNVPQKKRKNPKG